jgi:hypothetical protein
VRWCCYATKASSGGNAPYSIYLNRDSTALAWASRPSSLAKAAIFSTFCCNAFSLYEIMLDFFWKSSTFNGLEKRAVPFVGSTWFGPAK